MWTFLNSAILFGLAAVTIPIFIHLFTRHKIKIVNFSSLRFLKELQKQKIRRLKLRQILLLILRTLLILALVLAFARPAIKQTASSSLQTGAQLTAVIILDNTLSMGRELEGQKLLDKAKKRALDVVNLMRPGDEIYLLYPLQPPVFAHEGARYSLESVRELIEATELSYGSTDFATAFSFVDDIMRNSNNINKEVYLICDMQKNGLRLTGNGNGAKWFDERVKLFVLPITNPKSENLAISKIRFGNQILEKGKVVEIEAFITNHSEKAMSNKLVHLFVNGKRVAQNGVSLEKKSTKKVVFRMVPDRSGRQSGYVLLEDDDLLEDNRRYFTFEIPDEVSVLLVGNRHEDTYLIRLALNPEKHTPSHIKHKEILSKELMQADLDNYEVVIFSNIPSLDNVETMKIKNFVAAGGGLMVFLGADVDLRNYNENLHKKLNLPLLTESTSSKSGEQFLSLGRIDFSHSIFRDVFEDEKNVISPHFRFIINLKSNKPVDRIIEFSNGAPFLFESRFRKGRIMYVTTGITNDWSDLPLRGLFVPLVNRTVAYLAGSGSGNEDEIVVGEEITYYPEGNISITNLTMESPGGPRIRIKPEVSKGRYFIRFGETDLTGIYGLYEDDEIVAKWAVNYNPVEADYETFSSKDLAEVVAVERIYEIKQDDDIAEKLTESRFGRELWKYFMVITLVLLGIEMLIYREKPGT